MVTASSITDPKARSCNGLPRQVVNGVVGGMLEPPGAEDGHS